MSEIRIDPEPATELQIVLNDHEADELIERGAKLNIGNLLTTIVTIVTTIGQLVNVIRPPAPTPTPTPVPPAPTPTPPPPAPTPTPVPVPPAPTPVNPVMAQLQQIIAMIAALFSTIRPPVPAPVPGTEPNPAPIPVNLPRGCEAFQAIDHGPCCDVTEEALDGAAKKEGVNLRALPPGLIATLGLTLLFKGVPALVALLQRIRHRQVSRGSSY